MAAVNVFWICNSKGATIMCGLYGYSIQKAPIDAQGKAMLRRVRTVLAGAMESRGKDSWGWLERTSEGIITDKDVGPLTSLWPLSMPDGSGDLAMGHTRLATHGSVTRDNAHPFEYGACLGMHNGMIWNYRELGDYTVDSEALINRIGCPDLGTPDECDGYGTVQWIDTETGIGHLCRMTMGDLEVAMLRFFGARVLVWASDMDHISTVLRHMGIEPRAMPIPSEGRVYKVISGQLVDSGDRIDLGEYNYYYGWGEITSTRRPISRRQPRPAWDQCADEDYTEWDLSSWGLFKGEEK